MKVSLIEYTPNALDVLIFTKSTRLKMSAGLYADIQAWPIEKKLEELEYMRNTIASSWEFVDYIFHIEGVSRAFTHQLVRHRAGVSFAQQAQRAVDMSGFEFICGDTTGEPDADMLGAETGLFMFHNGQPDQLNRHRFYKAAMGAVNSYYQELLRLGANKQDARGILPTNISTNICFKANLRTLSEMGQTRLCVKSQGEFQDVFREIRERVMEVHPWTERFIRVHCAKWGVCKFPSYPTSDCPAKPFVYNPETGEAYGGGRASKPDDIQKVWELKRAEAQP